MDKQILIDSLIEEFQNSKHAVVKDPNNNGVYVVSTDYRTLVKKAVDRVWRQFEEKEEVGG